MKSWLNITVIIAFLCCYTEWGQNHSMFIFQMQFQELAKQQHIIQVITHPIIMSGLIGECLLFICAVYSTIPRWVNYIGIGLLACIVSIFSLAGILDANWKIIVSTMPFWILSFLLIKQVRKK